MVNPDNSSVTWAYNALQRPKTFTNELGHSDQSTYDPVGNLLTSEDADGNVWTYTYDAHGSLLTETSPDPDGAGPLVPIVTAYEYHTGVYSNLKKITNADSSTRHFTYNADDNLAIITDELGRVTTYSYDRLERLAVITMPAVAGGVAIHRWSYDTNGKVSRGTVPDFVDL